MQSVILDNLQNDMKTFKKVNLNSHSISIVSEENAFHVAFSVPSSNPLLPRFLQWGDSMSTAMGNFTAPGENIHTLQLQ